MLSIIYYLDIIDNNFNGSVLISWVGIDFFDGFDDNEKEGIVNEDVLWFRMLQ